VVPDDVVEMVSYTAGDADRLAAFPDITEFVLETAAAGTEMGLQPTASILY